MKTLKFIQGWGIGGLCTLLLALIGLHGFRQYRQEAKEHAFQAFQKAVQKEYDFIDFVYGAYDSRLSPNDISKRDKDEWCNQAFLIETDPERLRLDSLFRAEVAEQNFPVWTAIRCTYGDRIIQTCTTEDLQQAVALPEIYFQKDYSPEQAITLQAYIRMPLGVLLNRPYLYILSVVWLVGCMMWVLHRKRVYPVTQVSASSESMSCQEELQLIPVWRDICFCELTGILKNKIHETRLKPQQAAYFKLLLQSPDHIVTFTQIGQQIYHHNHTDFADESDKQRIAQAIARLRKDLEPFSLEVKSLYNIGYQLIRKETER